MLGQLPQSLTVCGKEYEIRSDFRNILTIIAAYNDDSLPEQEKAFICLRRIFVDLESIPRTDKAYAEALKAAYEFIDCKLSDDRPGPQVLNWEKDEQMIFTAVNTAAGMEVRLVEYMHWWTFLGYFMSIDRDSLLGLVLTIRQKKAKGKKLEDHEKEFLNSNPELCALVTKEERKTPEDILREMYEQLLKEGGADNGG